MNAAWYDLAIWLDANGYGTLGSDLFGGEWGQPDSQILVLDGVSIPTVPVDLTYADPQTELYEQPTVQILSRGQRGTTSNAAYQSIKAIYDALIQLQPNTIMNSVEYKGWFVSSAIIPLGMDENQRHLYSMNFYAYRNGVS